MEGVIVLNEVSTEIASGWFGIVLTILAIGFVCSIGLCLGMQNKPSAILCIVFGVMLLLAILCCICNFDWTKERQEYQEVIVEDSVSLNEFFDHYEIISQRGKIYKVKEITK